MAMAVAETIEAIAETGSRNMANGTSSTVAMVAVKPGMQPTIMPKREDPSMVISTTGSETSVNARRKASMKRAYQ